MSISLNFIHSFLSILHSLLTAWDCFSAFFCRSAQAKQYALLRRSRLPRRSLGRSQRLGEAIRSAQAKPHRFAVRSAQAKPLRVAQAKPPAWAEPFLPRRSKTNPSALYFAPQRGEAEPSAQASPRQIAALRRSLTALRYALLRRSLPPGLGAKPPDPFCRGGAKCGAWDCFAEGFVLLRLSTLWSKPNPPDPLTLAKRRSFAPHQPLTQAGSKKMQRSSPRR